MPNSVLWVCLVAVWLFVLVPMVIKGRPQMRKSTVAAKETRLLHRGGTRTRSDRRRSAGSHPHDPSWTSRRAKSDGAESATTVVDEEDDERAEGDQSDVENVDSGRFDADHDTISADADADDDAVQTTMRRARVADTVAPSVDDTDGSDISADCDLEDESDADHDADHDEEITLDGEFVDAERDEVDEELDDVEDAEIASMEEMATGEHEPADLDDGDLEDSADDYEFDDEFVDSDSEFATDDADDADDYEDDYDVDDEYGADDEYDEAGFDDSDADDSDANDHDADDYDADDYADADEYEDLADDVETDRDGVAEAPARSRRRSADTASRSRRRSVYSPDARQSELRYRERQRVLIGLLTLLVIAGGVGFFVGLPGWIATGVLAVMLVAYLGYLRRTVALEQKIRAQRAARARRSERELASRRRRADAAAAFESAPPPPRLRRPGGATVLEIDDEDPVFDHLPPFQRRRIMREDDGLRRVAG
ncbi:divisome protein SepX/GlpR [Gordonia aquimaris]|uniref:Transmembrane protein n=1 Tax=Gordonia aquimaris TaxID=2984863 RepID=A0A9X3D0R9_9ACTN|nr:gephyrin-like molybdotransferase receptor GlpR [Gordonia aquimaris]MCX2962721.1 hypothetical protein [Gordonia aquimaris]